MTYATLEEKSISTYNSIGMSPIAKKIDDLWETLRSASRESCSSSCVEWGLAQSDFMDLIDDACSDNWDGYGAKALTREVIFAAYRFMNAVPVFVSPPEIGVAPTGFISFLYREAKNPRNHINIIVTTNELHFAYKIGRSEGAGKSPFDHEIPSDVSKLIRGVIRTG